MFEIGELIIYGNTGVCRVQGTKRFSDSEEEYYVLEPLYSDGVIYTPVKNPKIFMRAVITRDEAEALIDSIPQIEVEAYHNPNIQQLSAHYEEALKSHDCADLMELTMSIFRKKQIFLREKRKFGSVDEKFMRRAEDQLFGELAIALDMERERVQAYIASRVEGQPCAL